MIALSALFAAILLLGLSTVGASYWETSGAEYVEGTYGKLCMALGISKDGSFHRFTG